MSSAERRGADGCRPPLLGVIALGLCLGGCASGGGSLGGEQGVFQPAAESVGAGPVSTPGVAALSADYRINPRDVLEVTVFQVKDLDRTVQVAPTGVINLPLIGGVTAAGRTARELERDIAARLSANYLRSPQVSVTIKEAASQSLTVDGAVMKPGVFPMNGAVTLLQALAQAQGFSDVANKNSVIVSRIQDGRRMVAGYDAAAIQSGKAPDPALQAGDIVVVEESGVKTTLRDTSRTLAPITTAVGAVKPW